MTGAWSLWLAVMVGGGIGSGARFGVNILTARLFGAGFPWGTLAVNLIGSAVMGVLVALFDRWGADRFVWRAFATTGFLGGFTTFSTYSLDAAALLDRGETSVAALYAVGSAACGVAALLAARALTKSMVG